MFGRNILNNWLLWLLLILQKYWRMNHYTFKQALLEVSNNWKTQQGESALIILTVKHKTIGIE